MTPEDRDRLTRVETMLESFTGEMRRYVDAQEKSNEIFYATAQALTNMKSQAKGAWFTVGIFGSLTVAVSGAVAWVVTYLTGRPGGH